MTAKDIINEKTSVPISMVGVVISIVVGVVMWGKSLEAKMEEHAKYDEARVLTLQAKADQTQVMFLEISQRLARIEGAIGVTK